MYWVYHSVMDKKTVPDGYRFSVHKYKNVMASGWKLRQFMIGRYGVDDLSRVQIIAALVLLLVSTFLRVNILYWLGLALLIYSYFRILSRNVSKRYEENQRFLNAKYNAGHSVVLTVFSNAISADRQSGCRREEERSALPVRNVRQNLSKKADKGEMLCVWLY